MFFKQKSAYEMRISDRSSDVCSSDLAGAPRAPQQDIHEAGTRKRRRLFVFAVPPRLPAVLQERLQPGSPPHIRPTEIPMTLKQRLTDDMKEIGRAHV